MCVLQHQGLYFWCLIWLSLAFLLHMWLWPRCYCQELFGPMVPWHVMVVCRPLESIQSHRIPITREPLQLDAWLSGHEPVVWALKYKMVSSCKSSDTLPKGRIGLSVIAGSYSEPLRCKCGFNSTFAHSISNHIQYVVPQAFLMH